MPDNVSPRRTTRVDPATAGVADAESPAGEVTAAPDDSAGADCAVAREGSEGLEIDPSRSLPPETGAAAAAPAPASWPGVYTGGSNKTVYSRISLPRAQLASMSSVRKGSVIASVERSLITSLPSGLWRGCAVMPARKAGQ